MKISGGRKSKMRHCVFFSSQNQKETTATSMAMTPAGEVTSGAFIGSTPCAFP